MSTAIDAIPQNSLLNQSRVAAQLAIEEKTLQAWRCRGFGPAFSKIGRLVRYRQEDVEKFIESRRVVNTSEGVK